MWTNDADNWSIPRYWLDDEGCLKYYDEYQMGWSDNINWDGLQTKWVFDESEWIKSY